MTTTNRQVATDNPGFGSRVCLCRRTCAQCSYFVECANGAPWQYRCLFHDKEILQSDLDTEVAICDDFVISQELAVQN